MGEGIILATEGVEMYELVMRLVFTEALCGEYEVESVIEVYVGNDKR